MSTVALVTGGGSGIGRASTIALARAGFTVVCSGRGVETLEETASLAGNGAIAISCDVRDPTSVETLFSAIHQRLGRLDVLFNNAGTGAPAVPLDELSVDDWHAVVATNLTGAFLCTRQAFALMKRQMPWGGRIINNGSLGAHAASALCPLHGDEARDHRSHQVDSLDGRAFDIACGRSHRERGHPGWPARRETGVVRRRVHRTRADNRRRARRTAVVYMATLPLDANVQFMTVMATKMPFVGRG